MTAGWRGFGCNDVILFIDSVYKLSSINQETFKRSATANRINSQVKSVEDCRRSGNIFIDFYNEFASSSDLFLLFLLKRTLNKLFR